MGNGRFNGFDERRGYVGTHPQLLSPVTALSLGGLRRRIEVALLPEVDVDIRLGRGSSATAGGCRGGRGGLILIPVFAQSLAVG